MVEFEREQVRFEPHPSMWVCPPHKKWVHGHGEDEKVFLGHFWCYKRSDCIFGKLITSNMSPVSFMVGFEREQVRFGPHPSIWVWSPHKKWVHGHGEDEKAVLGHFW